MTATGSVRAADSWAAYGRAVIILVVLLHGTSTLQVFLGSGSLLRLLKTALIAAMLAATAFGFRHVLRAARAAPELVLLHVLAVLSVAWSVEPSLTLKAALPLLAACCFMLTIASLYSMRQILLLLGLVATWMAVASLVAVALVPSARGAPPWDNVWRGVFAHKNALGSASAFGLLLAGNAALVAQGRLRALLAVGALLNALLLLGSESRTSQIICFVGVSSLAFALLSRRRLAASVVILLGFLLAALAVYVALTRGWLDPVLAAAGRKPTLSGRIPLWEVTWPFAADRPWLGWGYQAFWDPLSARVLSIADSPSILYVPFYSHNGLIETLLNLGLAGLVLLVFVLVRAFGTAFGVLSRAVGGQEVYAAFTFVLCFLLLNVTESSILDRDGILWMQFVLIAAKLSLLGAASARRTLSVGQPTLQGGA